MSSRSSSRMRTTPQPPRSASPRATTFAALAAERGLKDKDIDLGTVAKSAIIDPRCRATPPSRSRRAKSARRCRAVSAPRSCASARSSPKRCSRLKKSRREIKQDIATERAKTRDRRRCYDKIEDERAGRRDAGGGRRRSSSSIAHDRGSTAPAGIRRQARPGLAADAQTLSTAAFGTESGSRTTRCKCRRRLSSGSMSPASRRRAIARSTRSRTRSRRAGATTRSPSD